MIAIDTSSLIAFLDGSAGPDVDAVDWVLEHRQAVLPPVVLSELWSDPLLPERTMSLLAQLPVLEVRAGYWERVGRLRARVISKGRRARLAGALIAQSCLDHRVPLTTRDKDFHSFARYGGLELFL